MSGGPRFGVASFAGCGLLAIWLHLVPFSQSADGRGLPDLVFCLVAAWMLRHPASAPLPAVLLLGLLADLLLMRPLGLGVLALVLASEVLRAKRTALAGVPFVLEWAAVAALFALTLAGSSLALGLAFVNGPDLDALLEHLAVTAVGYPLVVAVLQFAIGLRGPGRETPARRLW